jgi:Rrf2 family transcriptional regulator, iron-sulfur cluster assembly transcription factor
MLNHTAEYALRAVLYLAAPPRSGPVRVGEIAQALGVPQNYLSKTLGILAQRGLLSSQRGPTGGFALARDPAEITLAEVIEPFDPLEDRCLLMRRRCSDAAPCLAHHRWKRVATGIRSFFRETSLADLAREGSAARAATFSLVPGLEE